MTQVCKLIAKSPRAALNISSELDDVFTASFFKALSDPTRLELLKCLAKCPRPCSVTEIAECCSADFSVVSRHLQQLYKAGFLLATKKSRTMYYSVAYKDISKVFSTVAKVFSTINKNKSGACCE